jgi:hypothetical protein
MTLLLLENFEGKKIRRKVINTLRIFLLHSQDFICMIITKLGICDTYFLSQAYVQHSLV